MAAEIPTESAQPPQATIAVHGGARSEEQPFGVVVSPVSHPTTLSFQSFVEVRRCALGGVLPLGLSRLAT